VLSDLDKTARLIAKRTAEMEDPDLDSATDKVFAGQIPKATARVSRAGDGERHAESHGTSGKG